MGKKSGIKLPRLDQVLNTVANVGIQVASLGMAGLDEDGKLKKGVVLHGLDEGVGEITGRNQARKALMDQQDALNEEKRQSAIDEENRRLQIFRSDVNASRTAQAVRNTAAIRGGQAPAGSTLGTDDEELLGL